MPTTRGLALTPLLVCSHPLQDGNTPLHDAAACNASATAEVLLKHKADVNARNEVGNGCEELVVWIYRGYQLGLKLRVKGVIGGRMQGCDEVQSVVQWG